MLSDKVLVFLSFQVLAVLGLGGNAFINLPQLDEEQIKWPQQKIQTIEYLLKTLSEVGNVTLVGWQQILNSDGTLKEIKTIELTLLTPLSSVNTLQEEEMGLISEALTVLQLQDTIDFSTGILVSGSVGQWARDATILKLIELQGASSIKGQSPEFGKMLYWQQNMTVPSLTPIQNLVKTLQQQTSDIPVGVLQFNSDGTLNLDHSIIVPELLGTVLKAENATLEMAESALTGLAKGYLLHQNQIPKYVASYMKQTVPGYVWVAGQAVDSVSVNPGAQLSVLYFWSDVSSPPIQLDVIGIKI